MSRQARHDSGFSLLEVLLALTISALVVTAAHRIFTGVVDATKDMNARRSELDREMNGHRWLTEALGALEVGVDSASFLGRPDRVEFSSWQRTAAGWLRPEPMLLVMSGDTLRLQGKSSIAIVTSVSAVAFDYLLEPGADSRWVREWISPVSAPLAIRLRLERPQGVDTLLFLVGPRG
jgi:prepilin-type N-terminal cleavage/methylation domain-containing protein